MSDITTTKCRICLGQIKQESEFEPIDDTTLELKSERDLSITDNPVACNKCKIEIDADHRFHTSFVKEEIKRELVEEEINNEDLVVDDCMLFKTDIDEKIRVNIFYYCDQCNYATNDKKNLTDHVFTHRFKCDRCSYTTIDNCSLINHKQTHIMTGTLKCNVCNYTCLESRSLHEHMSSHMGARFDIYHQLWPSSKRFFKCHDCGYQTFSKITLKIHMRIHKKLSGGLLTMDKIVSGANRPLKINSKNVKQIRLNKKVSKSTSTKRFNKTKKQKFFNKHIRYVNVVTYRTLHSEVVAFKCRLCDFSSKSRRYLREHVMKHSGELPYSCDKCAYKTSRKYHLQQHKIIHSEEKPLKCNLCDYSCYFSHNLKAHLRNHSGELFGCDQCAYKTNAKSNLQKHKKIHLEEKPFKCSFCDYSCNFSQHLKSHLMKHSGEQPFSCDKCVYKTSRKYLLQRHKTVHTEEKKFLAI
ncbi:hypothetical protein FQR65_LT12263 [Abscondita terminalis]|nr:hypothetical protein FQR65_LT12263 [Abscondita terminalis]